MTDDHPTQSDPPDRPGSGEDDPTLDDRSDPLRPRAVPSDPADERTVQWIGRTVGRYRVMRMIDVGATGCVFEALDPTLERSVAIKVLSREFAVRPTARTRFLSEAKAAAQLSHPHVVPIFEIGQHGDDHYIVMEMMTGGSAAQRLSSGGAFSAAEATRTMIEACRGIAIAHAAGFVHRDIKPGNLLRDQHGITKIADFGLIKGETPAAGEATQEGVIVGTPAFMSPEQCKSEPVDQRSDIYSIGATYFALLTGSSPFTDAKSSVQIMMAHCQADIPDPRSVEPALPERCTAIVMKAMAKRPDDRYASVDEMLGDLEAVADQLGPEAHALADSGSSMYTRRPTAMPPAPTKRRGRTASLVVALLIVVGLVGLGVFFASGGDRDAATIGAVEQGVTDDTITLGMSAAFSGPNGELGRDLVSGIRACIRAANAEGGVHGRRIELIAVDDGYEPERAAANIRELHEKRKVFAFIGNVGTPTALVTKPYAVERRRLFYAPLTGASLLRQDPPDRYVFNYRASYADETAAIIHYFTGVRRIAPERIAVFAQRDAYGDDGFHGVVDALFDHGVDPESILRINHERNSVDVNDAVAELAANKDRVDAVVIVSTYSTTAEFISRAREDGIDAAFACVSFVGSDGLAERFGEIGAGHGDGVIVTQVVPHFESGSTGVRRYREALEHYLPEAHPSFVSLEGFVAAEVLIEALRRAGRDLTTERLIDTMESLRDVDLGIGSIITFGPSRHQASTRVWGTMLDGNGNYRIIDLDRP